MESPQAIKSRLKSVKNVGQITKAMEVVAATKMRKSQETALGTRPYAFEALHLLRRLTQSVDVKVPLLAKREVKKTLVVIIASDRGLAGSFNSQVARQADQFFAGDEYKDKENHSYYLSVMGKKAVSYAAKKSYPTLKIFTDFGEITEPEEIKPLSSYAINGFLKGEWDRVVTISTQFRSALKQEPLVRQILPLDTEKIKATVKEIVPETGRYAEMGKELPNNNGKEIEYIFEPSPRAVLEELLPHLVEMEIYHLFLEAKASEHSARRVAMKTASDNAGELADELTLEFNKARQVGITGEIMEITTTITTLE